MTRNDTTGDAETTSAKTRWRWTNDVLAGVIVAAHVTLIASTLVVDVQVPGRVWDVFVLEALLATTWAFGPSTLQAISNFRNGGGGSGGEGSS
ncbi:hypothetical protein [Salarchaeum japonicum]|uniref:hypothetical protein n=1 Tax=Salarchaeum japonicum TaxID=555573 RepID=UPI003C792023